MDTFQNHLFSSFLDKHDKHDWRSWIKPKKKISLSITESQST